TNPENVVSERKRRTTWFFRSEEAARFRVSQGLYDIDLVPVFLAKNLDIHLSTDEWHDMLAHARIAVRSRAVSSTSANSAESAEHVVDDEGAARRQRISQLESQLAALQKVACLRHLNEKKSFIKKLNRVAEKVRQMQSQRSRRREDDGDDFLRLERSKKGKHLSLRGKLSLAIRRNFSNCATADIGAILLEDISRYSVSRYESRAGTALVASSRLFYSSLYDDLTAPSDAMQHFQLVFHSYRQDATNSGILRGSKLAALILHSATLKNAVTGTGDASWGHTSFVFDDWYEPMIRVADVLPVESSTSSDTVAQTLKQLDGLGCITWKTVEQDDKLQKFHGC
ncbi:unnamed protein product, partial [Symbiodinium necroappetens]